MEKIISGIMVMISLMAIKAEKAMAGEMRYESVNRAPDAVVSASSYRRQKFSEVLGGSILLYAPQVWNHWIPGYAVDKDNETFWASEPGESEWLELELGNRLMPSVPIKRIVINWGKNLPRGVSVVITNERKVFQPLLYIKPEQKIIEFDSPEKGRFLLLLFHPGEKNQGVSIREIEVYGPEEDAPSAPVSVRAEALGPQEIKLSWRYPEKDSRVYLFKIYRGDSAGFAIDRAHLIEETAQTEFVDKSLKPGTVYYYKIVPEGFSGIQNVSAARVSATTLPGTSYSRMPIRGVIEGFYNEPWPHTERVRLLRFIAQNSFNHYIYAPKNDPYHRQLWRESYPDDQKENFRELVDTASALGISFTYGISPGLNINYNDPAEVETLKKKLKEMFELGVRSFILCLDDIPGSDRADEKMALDQVKLVDEIHRYLKSLDKNCELFFCPTVYSFPYSYWQKKNKRFAGYLETLARIDKEVLIMWTGPSQTFSDVIDLESAMEYKKLWSRPILIWDNYPVNDVSLQKNIFLGPYLGRDLKLGEAVAGIFSNPMFLSNANRIPLFTMGRYFSVENYDPWHAYEEALRVVGKGAESPLKALADCLLNHPMFPSRTIETLPVKKQIDEFWKAYNSGNYQKELTGLKALFESYASNPEALANLENQRLYYELKPASEKLSLYGRACLKALEYLEEKDSDKRGFLKKEARQMLKQAKKNKWKVADPGVSALYALIGAKPQNQPVLEKFVKDALKK